MATHSTILPWKIPRTEGPGRLQFLRSQRVGHERKLWNRRIICILFTFRLRLTHWNQHFIDMRKNHEKLLMLLTLFLCCNWDSRYSHNSPNSSQPHQPMTHFFLVLFFMHLLPFSFSSFSSSLNALWLSFQMTLDLLSWLLSPLCPHFFPSEILHKCSPVCPSVPFSGRSSTQRRLSGWPGAGPRCWTFCLKLCAERPCCCSLCLVSHEWHTVDSDWDFVDTNVYTHFYQW